MRIRQEAVTIVTFALVAPVLLLILLGTMEMGRVLNAWLVITNEAREAARYGAVTYDNNVPQATEQANEQTAIRAFVQQRLSGVLAADGIYRQPDIVLVPTGQNQSPLVQVTIYYQVPLVIPLVSQFFPNPFPVVARSAMRGE